MRREAVGPGSKAHGGIARHEAGSRGSDRLNGVPRYASRAVRRHLTAVRNGRFGWCPYCGDRHVTATLKRDGTPNPKALVGRCTALDQLTGAFVKAATRERREAARQAG